MAPKWPLAAASGDALEDASEEPSEPAPMRLDCAAAMPAPVARRSIASAMLARL